MKGGFLTPGDDSLIRSAAEDDSEASGARLVVWAPYWLVNKTGLPLTRVNGVSSHLEL